MTASWDVVALGEAMVEFNQTRPGEPHYLQGFGGDTSNAVIAAARAGARTAYLTRLGQDTFGDALMALWQREGVDTRAASNAMNGRPPAFISSRTGAGPAVNGLIAIAAQTLLLPVGGIGSSLYQPGMSAADVERNALDFNAAWAHTIRA